MTFWDEAELGRQVVIDAGAAIRLKRLERFGGELLTTSGVYAEVWGPYQKSQKTNGSLLCLRLKCYFYKNSVYLVHGCVLEKIGKYRELLPSARCEMRMPGPC